MMMLKIEGDLLVTTKNVEDLKNVLDVEII